MVTVRQLILGERPPFPNSLWPLLHYTGVFPGATPVASFWRLFTQNGWQQLWENGLYPYDHFHALAHEVLGCARGWAWLRLGGPGGERLLLTAGEAVLLPAGTGHALLEATPDYRIVGAYPPGQIPDLERGDLDRYFELREKAAAVRRPERDPVQGGPLCW